MAGLALQPWWYGSVCFLPLLTSCVPVTLLGLGTHHYKLFSLSDLGALVVPLVFLEPSLMHCGQEKSEALKDGDKL